jgi:hypothetical protein
MNTSTAASLSPTEFYSLIRGQIEHEDNLIGQRLSWFITSQSFFFTAYAIVVSNMRPGMPMHHQQRLLYLVIPVAALASCSLIYCTAIAGHLAITALRRLYERESAGNPLLGLPPVHGFRRTQMLGEAGPLYLPAIFVILWIFLLYNAS